MLIYIYLITMYYLFIPYINYHIKHIYTTINTHILELTHSTHPNKHFIPIYAFTLLP